MIMIAFLGGVAAAFMAGYSCMRIIHHHALGRMYQAFAVNIGAIEPGDRYDGFVEATRVAHRALHQEEPDY